MTLQIQHLLKFPRSASKLSYLLFTLSLAGEASSWSCLDEDSGNTLWLEPAWLEGGSWTSVAGRSISAIRLRSGNLSGGFSARRKVWQ